MSIAHRLTVIIERENLKVKEMAEKLKVSTQGLKYVIEENRSPRSAMLQNILYNFPHYNAEWLLTGKGSMLKELSENDTHQTSEQAELYYSSKSYEQIITELKAELEATKKEKEFFRKLYIEEKKN